MRRLLVVGALGTVGFLMLRTRLPQLKSRMMARCEEMLERAPDGFPPKKMLRGIEETRVNTRRILDLLEADTNEHGASATAGVDHAA